MLGYSGFITRMVTHLQVEHFIGHFWSGLAFKLFQMVAVHKQDGDVGGQQLQEILDMSMEEFCSNLEEGEENESVDGEEEEQSDEEDQGGED